MKLSVLRSREQKWSQRARDVVSFRGHPMVRSEHPTTIEVTTEDHLTARGDCIIGVGASKGCAQLGEDLKKGLRTEGSRVLLKVVVGPHSFVLAARGDPRLELSHPHDIVVRKSTFLSDRTVALEADSAARDIPRPMIRLLRNPTTRATLELEVL
jgi:uncharacterized protein